jgi:LEA14-like dessication related protein
MRCSLPGFFLLLSCLLWSVGCARVPADLAPPTVTLADLRPAGSSLFEHRFDMGLRVRNDNGFTLPLYGIRCLLEINGRPLLQGGSREPVSIPPLSSRVVRVQGVVTALDLLGQLRGLQPGREVSYLLSGTAYLTSDLRRSVPFVRKGILPSFPFAP